MGQVWCVECREFVDLEGGACVKCGRVTRGYAPVSTGRSTQRWPKVDHENILDSSDVAEMFGVRVQAITEMARESKIPMSRSGGIWVAKRDVLIEWEREGRPTNREDVRLYARGRSAS